MNKEKRSKQQSMLKPSVPHQQIAPSSPSEYYIREQSNYKKLLKGNSYLISEKTNKNALDFFLGFTQANYHGLYITRAYTETMKSRFFSSKIVHVSLLNHEKIIGTDTISTLDALLIRIKDFSSRHANAVVLLERIDYLIMSFSFEEFVRCLYKITSIISKHKSILLVHLNPLLVDSRQSTILEEELRSVLSPELDNIEIDDELHTILQFVLENNQRHSVVSFKKIRRAFSIDKTTTAKRVKLLENIGLIVVKKIGREKTVRLSKKGDELFQRIHNV